VEENLETLKDYMTDTRRFYGFEIQEITVQDTAFLFKRETVPLAEKQVAMKRIFEFLINYANQQNAGYNGTRIFYTLQSANEITLFASIGVTNMIEPSAASGIEYKRMPLGKNLIAASYQGPFGQSEKAFRALEMFKKDHNLSSMAIPFQKFMSDGYDFSDDQVVQLKIYYPVF
jgi:effector-binding domain-containing protein